LQRTEAAASAGYVDEAAAAAPQLKRVSLGRRRGDLIHTLLPQFRIGTLLLATVLAGPVYAQTPRPPILEPISDARLEAQLQTAADTLALLKLTVPAAIDSLRTAGDSTWPQLLVVTGVDSALAHAWLTSLVKHRRVQGLCAPIRMQCDGFEAVRVSLENEPGLGDNEVRLILSLVRVRQRSRTVRYEDEERRWQAMLAAGIPMPGECWGAPCGPPDGVLGLVPRFVLTTVASPDGWHIVRWRRDPEER